VRDVDDDTDADDICRRGNIASINGPVRDARDVIRGRRSRVKGRGDGVADHRQDSDQRHEDVPLDFEDVRSQLVAGCYTSIVCTAAAAAACDADADDDDDDVDSAMI